MKNTLAENMLRFGVKNLKESDVKRIEKAVLTEAVINKDLYADPKWKKAIDAVSEKQPQGSMTPYNVGQYIFVPNDPMGAGLITTFTTGYYGLPMLNPLTYGKYKDLEFALIDIVQAANDINVKAPDVTSYAKQLNDAFNKLPLAVLQAAYAANPGKATYDKMIGAFKTTVAQTQPGTRSAQQTLAASLTGNAKMMLVG
jgi:hypothetical protein